MVRYLPFGLHVYFKLVHTRRSLDGDSQPAKVILWCLRFLHSWVSAWCKRRIGNTFRS
jgi:hypothetical protein